MKRRQHRRQIKRRQETWWWHYLPLHRQTVGGHLGPALAPCHAEPGGEGS